MTLRPIHRIRSNPGGLIILLLLAVLLSGCSPSYVLRLAVGQLRIQSGSVPVERALEDPSLGAAEKEKLRLVARVKAFGERELGLSRSDNYETVYLGSEPNPIYTVTAALRTRLELVTWWFPVVGRMPYLGYFDPEDAAEKKRELEKEGMDVVIWPAEAYSTLGWFQDPVHRNLLGKDAVDLVETLLHEMTHATLYARGQPAFNETLASVVGKRGALAFLEADFGPGSREALEARALIRDERRFSRFIDDLMTRLAALYSRPLSDEEKLAMRERLFEEGRAGFLALEQELETDRFEGFGSGGINNAYLLAAGLYHRHFNLFESVIDEQGGSISQALEIFRRLSGKEGDLVRVTEDWLS
ncbi:MAG: aminopeptidase [Deltaproteobacteria bacterium]|nr:aminopeptidase [Deltaproteobacteria bacterium]